MATIQPNSPIKAIETSYAGCRFRSRLEARWAVFFDALGVRWEYEPEGYETPAGRYLPDFLLHLDRDKWFEVKPNDDGSGERSDDRWRHVVAATNCELVVARGLPRPDRHGDYVWSAPGHNGWMQSLAPGDCAGWCEEGGCPAGGPHRSSFWDNGRAFCICPSCGKVGLEFEGRAGRMACCGSDERWQTGENERIVAAYDAARMARFEHGERG